MGNPKNYPFSRWDFPWNTPNQRGSPRTPYGSGVRWRRGSHANLEPRSIPVADVALGFHDFFHWEKIWENHDWLLLKYGEHDLKMEGSMGHIYIYRRENHGKSLSYMEIFLGKSSKQGGFSTAKFDYRLKNMGITPNHNGIHWDIDLRFMGL